MVRTVQWLVRHGDEIDAIAWTCMLSGAIAVAWVFSREIDIAALAKLSQNL